MYTVLLFKRKNLLISLFKREVRIKLDVVDGNYLRLIYFFYLDYKMKSALIGSLGAELGTG
jgi:hypothetical protein